MPSIFEPKDLYLTRQEGMVRTMLADPAMLGANVLQVERITLDAIASSSIFEPAATERFIYVVRGAGRAFAGGKTFPLEAESLLWIEEDEPFSLQAGMDGLEVLFCRAPAG